MQVVRACFPNEKVKLFLRPLELCTLRGHRTKHARCGRVRSRNIRFDHVLSLQLAKASAATLSKNKASAATLSQQEEDDSEDVQRGGVNISGFLGEKVIPVLPTRFVPGRIRQPSDDARTASITLGSRLKSSREKAAWRWGARGRKRARRRKN